jgi:hypothetical protein
MSAFTGVAGALWARHDIRVPGFILDEGLSQCLADLEGAPASAMIRRSVHAAASGAGSRRPETVASDRHRFERL